jgi:6-phosphofructokinase 2
MAKLLTITMNPSIDTSTSVDRVIPSRKLRCGVSREDPGGGGVNVARAAKRLGADVLAIYTTGGERGHILHRLLQAEGIEGVAVPIASDTREDFTVDEESSGNQYRFVSAGPEIRDSEWRAALEALATFDDHFDFFVASGSLPPGVPDDFYARVAEIARTRGVPFALDASGPSLRIALESGGIDLLKPSLREMRELTGEKLADLISCAAACRRFVDEGKAKLIALTLGGRGAILVGPQEVWLAFPIPVAAVSTVGAGDSFLAGMLTSLGSGKTRDAAFRRAVAAGSAALLAPGTQLCRLEDVNELEIHARVERMFDAKVDEA